MPKRKYTFLMFGIGFLVFGGASLGSLVFLNSFVTPERFEPMCGAGPDGCESRLLALMLTAASVIGALVAYGAMVAISKILESRDV